MQRSNAVAIAGGTGLGVLLVDVLLDRDVVSGLVKGIVAAVIVLLLIAVFDRIGRRS